MFCLYYAERGSRTKEYNMASDGSFVGGDKAIMKSNIILERGIIIPPADGIIKK